MMAVAEPLRARLAEAGIRVRLDDREQHRPGYKFAEWEVKGVPIRIELGPRDVAARRRCSSRASAATKEEVPIDDVASGMADRLNAIQRALFDDAVAFREANTHQITSFDDFATGVEEQGGFWVGPWCGDGTCEAEIARGRRPRFDSCHSNRSIRMPCIHCGKPGVDAATGRGPTDRCATAAQPHIVSIAEIREAAERIRGVATRTPLLRWDDTTWLKPESLQPVGAFKMRGAYNKVASLTDAERARGVVTYSSGTTRRRWPAPHACSGRAAVDLHAARMRRG